MVCTNPDPTQMAQEFLKQWQKHITQAMTDPSAIKATLEAMQGFYTAPSEPRAGTHDARTRRPAAAPDAADDAIRDLTRRLERLEQSVRQLSAALDAAQKPARAKPRRVAKPVAANKRPAKRAVKPVAKSAAPAKRTVRKKKK